MELLDVALAQVGEAPCIMGLLGLLSYTLGVAIGKTSSRDAPPRTKDEK